MIVLIGCNNQSMTERMNEIDSLVASEQYDSAYVSLIRIDKSKLIAKEDRAHYYLLLTQTSLLTHHSDTMSMLDSLVIPYYSNVTNHEKLAEAYYYKAYVEVIKKDFSTATLCYKNAEEHAMRTSNNRLQFKIAESLSYV